MAPEELEEPVIKPQDKLVEKGKKEQPPTPQPKPENYGLTLEELRKLQIYP